MQILNILSTDPLSTAQSISLLISLYHVSLSNKYIYVLLKFDF